MTEENKINTHWYLWSGKWSSSFIPGGILRGKVELLLQEKPLDDYTTNAIVSVKIIHITENICVLVDVNTQEKKKIVISCDNNGHTVTFTAHECLSKKHKRRQLTGKYRSNNPYDVGHIKLKIQADDDC